MTWQYTVAGYFAIGALTMIILLAAHYFVTSRNDGPDLQDILAEVRRKQYERDNRNIPAWKRQVEYALEKIVAPVLAALLVVVAWPLAIWWKAREMWSSGEPESIKAKEFTVEREHLIERQDLDALEARELVSDPLGAVPGRPFGHLNPAWLKFKANREPGDSIWTFSARWKPKWGREEIREGYVIVGLGGIGPHFLVTRRVLEAD